jgi:hypothetical protein
MSQEPNDRELPPDSELNRDAVKMIQDDPHATLPELMVKFALRWVRHQRGRAEKAEAERDQANYQLGRRQDALDIILNSAKWRGRKIKELKEQLEAALRGSVVAPTLSYEQQEQALGFLKSIASMGEPIWDMPHNGKPYFYDGYKKLNTGKISEIRAFLKSMGVEWEEEEDEDV